MTSLAKDFIGQVGLGSSGLESSPLQNVHRQLDPVGIVAVTASPFPGAAHRGMSTLGPGSAPALPGGTLNTDFLESVTPNPRACCRPNLTSHPAGNKTFLAPPTAWHGCRLRPHLAHCVTVP